MGLRGARAVGAVLFGVLWLGIASGCAGSGDDDSRLREALEELSSVGSPEGDGSDDLRVVGCDDEAEMPAGYAMFSHRGLDPTDVDAFNAELTEVAEWYLPRWRRLGWKADDTGSATKVVDGSRLRASIDVGKAMGYAIVVSADEGGLCS